MDCKCQIKVVKESLIGWSAAAAKDLEAVPYSQIAREIGVKRQVVTNYLTLSHQKTFDLDVVKRINEFRTAYKAKIKAVLAL